MRRKRITITVQENILKALDAITDKKTIRNRSHAIEFILSEYLKNKIETAVVFAGGEGTKLRPFTYEMPKPLLPINGKPILEYMIERLKASGIREVILCTGYLGDKIRNYFGDGRAYGVAIRYSEEKEPLQTGGALAKAREYLGGRDFILLNGDIITDFNIKDIIEYHVRENSFLTMGLTVIERPQGFGQLQLHGDQLVSFETGGATTVSSHIVNAGIYVCNSRIFEFFPKDAKIFMWESVLENMVTRNLVKGYVFNEKWFDIGSSQNYDDAIKYYSKKTVFK